MASAAPFDRTGARADLDRVAELQSAGRAVAAESLATRVLTRLAGAAGTEAWVAESWYRIALARAARQLPADSVLDAGLQALASMRAPGGVPDTIRFATLRLVGIRLSGLARPDSALPVLERAIALARSHPEWGVAPLSAALFSLGRACASAAMPDSALRVLREALVLRRALAQPKDGMTAQILSTMANAHVTRGDFGDAERAFAEAIRFQEQHDGPDSPGLIQPLADAAGFEMQRGDYARSLELYQRAHEIISASTPDHPNAIVLESAIAQNAMLTGDAVGARGPFERLVPRLEQVFGAGSVQALNARASLGTLYADLGEDDLALAEYRLAREWLERDSTRRESSLLCALLINEARLLLERAPTDTALALARRAEELGEPIRFEQPSLRLVAIALQLDAVSQRGAWAEVDRLRARLEQGIREVPGLGGNDGDAVWKALSEASMRRGRVDLAVRDAAEGTRRTRERFEQNVRALPDRRALAYTDLVSGMLEQLLEVGMFADAASRHRCWDELVRRRGFVRAEVARRRAPPEAASDTALFAAHARWLAAQRALAEAQAEAADRGPADSLLAARRVAADDAERSLARIVPAARLGRDPAMVGVDSVLAWLAPNQTLVSFIQVEAPSGRRHLAAFVATAPVHAITSLDLGEVAQLEPIVAEFHEQLAQARAATRDERACRRAGALVRARLWEPLRRVAPDSRDWVIVADAPLHGFAWGALPEGRGYLVESGVRIRLLDAERDLEPRYDFRPGVGLLAMGDIDPSSTPALRDIRRSASDCDSAAWARLGPLPGAGAEIDDIAAAWSGEGGSDRVAIRLRGALASEREFKRLAPGHRALHLATHGLVLGEPCAAAGTGTRGVGGVSPTAAPRRPAPSRTRRAAPARRDPSATIIRSRDVVLVLGASPDSSSGHAGEDGLLTAEEVGALDLRGVDWVVLSACQSAVGSYWKGEGVLGMQRAFRLAGARTVIASQWAVEDAATRDWMRALYRARIGGTTAGADAITAANRFVIAERRRLGRSTHPFYWAAFSPAGD